MQLIQLLTMIMIRVLNCIEYITFVDGCYDTSFVNKSKNLMKKYIGYFVKNNAN